MQSISFGNDYNKYNNRYNSSRPSSYQRTSSRSQEDSYVARRAQAGKTKRPPMPLWKKLGLFLSGVAAGAGATGTVNNIETKIQEKPTVAIVEVADQDTLDRYEKLFNTNAEAIIDYNNLDPEAPLTPGDTIKVPETFDNIKGAIDALKAQLSKKGLSSAERQEIMDKLNKLNNVKANQNAMAICYSDGKYVYLEMQDSYWAEHVKMAFGIEDGALKDNNCLEFTWGWNEEAEDHNAYMDYSDATLHAGQTYKVPLNKIASTYSLD